MDEVIHLCHCDINKIDVLIVGAGPVGLLAGEWFGNHEYKVVIIEKYSDCEFIERHQQVGLDPISLNLIREINKDIHNRIIAEGCEKDGWINIPIYTLQQIYYDQIKKYNNITILFNSRIEAVTCPYSKNNARVTVTQQNKLYGFYPELVVICDGRHDDKGVAKNHFNFPSASKVNLSSYGIIGMLQRKNKKITVCLKNYSSDTYKTEYGNMNVRLLGSYQERYIALGVCENTYIDIFKKLSSQQIYDLLKKTYIHLKDPEEPEFDEFTEYSKTPIGIVLDYRKETIKILEGSNTVVSVEGDAARKTTFFSGSGLNSAYQAINELFKFSNNNKHLIFNSQELLLLDQKLLEKDKAVMDISLNLLKKGISYLTDKKE